MKVVALSTFHESPGGLYSPGEELTVSEAKAKELIAVGLVREVGEQEGAAATKPSDPNTRQTKPAKDKPDTK